jgi:hypothetical protein
MLFYKNLPFEEPRITVMNVKFSASVMSGVIIGEEVNIKQKCIQLICGAMY